MYKLQKNRLIVAVIVSAVFVLAFFSAARAYNPPATSDKVGTATPKSIGLKAPITQGATPNPLTVTPAPKLTTLPYTATVPAAGIAIPGLTSLSDAAIKARMDDIKSLGFTWIRTDFRWPDIQPQNKSTYSWSRYDSIVKIASQDNLNILGILDYTPAWARDSSCAGGIKCPPTNPIDFANFAGTTSARYKTSVQAWEIWNEENSSNFWAPAPDAARYTTLLRQAYTSIKTSSPDSKVIVGGIASSNVAQGKIDTVSFLQQIYSNGGKGYFDAVGYHPYTYPDTPSDSNPSWSKMAVSNMSLASVMAANGDGTKKIWMTEFGAPTNGPAGSNAVTEDMQAELAQSMYNAVQNEPWAGPFFWYTYQDTSSNTNDKENFFGLKRADGSNKPAYDMWRELLDP